MVSTIIFKLVFVSQIIALSFFLPKLITKKIGAENEGHISKLTISRYLAMNYVAIVIGGFVLALIYFNSAFESVIYTLLATGIYFILQLSPLAFISTLFLQTKSEGIASEDSLSIFKLIHPFLVSLACLLFISYLAFSVAAWDSGFNTQLLHVSIFIGVNLYLVIAIVTSIRNVNKCKDGRKQKMFEHAHKIVPFFVYISIGISVYYFNKNILFSFELHEYRPIMMSIFVQLLGLLIIYRITPKSQKT